MTLLTIKKLEITPNYSVIPATVGIGYLLSEIGGCNIHAFWIIHYL